MFFSKKAATAKTAKKAAPKGPVIYPFSWAEGKNKLQFPQIDKNEIKEEDYHIENKKNETIVKSRGNFRGMQYAVEHLENCVVYLMDISESITIDECNGCKFLIAPVGGPVFLRNCRNCNFVLACHQFRTRECENLKIKLFCSTKPIIEDSKDIQFGCYDYFDVNLKAQFDNEEISIYSNAWSDIYDFTPKSSAMPSLITLSLPSAQNFSYLPEYQTWADLIPPLSQGEADYAVQNTFVPQTYALRTPKLPEENDILMIFHPGHNDDIALFFQCLKNLPGYGENFRVIQTFEKKFAYNQMEPMWKMKYIAWNDLKSPLVSLLVNGEGVSKILEEAGRKVVNNTNTKWYSLIEDAADLKKILGWIQTAT